MKRSLIFGYGAVSYLLFFGTFLYFIGFVGNLTPVAIDSPRQGALGPALLVNLGLIALFGVQHSVMARKPFKRWITRFIPEAAERSTFVLAATICLASLMYQWQPLGGMVWQVSGTGLRAATYALFGFGWVLVFGSTFAINHFDLFGLRQSWSAFVGRRYEPLRFRTPWLYRLVRHPLYLGFFFALWAAPVMSAAHLVLALGMTVYVLVAVQLEERDLAAEHPEYARYRSRVPMFVPGVGGSRAES